MVFWKDYYPFKSDKVTSSIFKKSIFLLLAFFISTDFMKTKKIS